MELIRAEYIWIDGQKPTAKMRSKTKILEGPINNLEDLPEWGFDGSSTNQAETGFSDCKLKPVKFIPDPIRGGSNILVLCEVFDFETDQPHQTNTRAKLREAFEKHKDQDPLFGVEQEYTMYDENGVRVLGWPEGGSGYPEPQGRYYCGVGSDEIAGRELIEKHTEALLEVGIQIAGTNAEVMLGQWEYQIGPVAALDGADQLWLSRWILYRLGEKLGITVKLDPKPISGDWNGTGAHINFSTKEMRESGGYSVIEEACSSLEGSHAEHIKVYGANNDERLTGEHETGHISEFQWDVAHRGVSVRIPAQVQEAGKGYLEDRRPAANIDPYQAFTALIETICGHGFNADKFKYFWENEKFWKID